MEDKASINEDNRYLSNPDRWAAWPLCPVKTRDRGLNREIGVVACEDRAAGWKVYMTNLFAFDPKCEVRVYATLGNLLKVWTVD